MTPHKPQRKKLVAGANIIYLTKIHRFKEARDVPWKLPSVHWKSPAVEFHFSSAIQAQV
jgi:hypothetical protein